MTENFLAMLRSSFTLRELDCGSFSTLKAKGMSFRIRCFYAEGLGHVSAMSASGLMGLMKMQTLVVNPFERDLPLFSYDRVLAMGRDSLYAELYDTFLEKKELHPLDEAVGRAAGLPDFDHGSHWYDPILLPQSLFKRGKKTLSPAFDAAAEDFFRVYLGLCASAPACDSAAKSEKAAAYSRELLEKGGPAVNVFIEKFGRETTGEFLRGVLFGA